jgi:hypothetical protein
MTLLRLLGLESITYLGEHVPPHESRVTHTLPSAHASSQELGPQGWMLKLALRAYPSRKAEGA